MSESADPTLPVPVAFLAEELGKAKATLARLEAELVLLNAVVHVLVNEASPEVREKAAVRVEEYMKIGGENRSEFTGELLLKYGHELAAGLRTK